MDKSAVRRYHYTMTKAGYRRAWACFLVLVIGIGVILHGAQAADMKMMAMAASQGAMPSDCDICGGGDDMTTADCDAMCVDPVAPLMAKLDIPVPPAPMPAVSAPDEGAGRTGPPAPYPTRS